MSYNTKYIEYVLNHLDKRELLEQLGEEGAEMVQAAMKLIRAEHHSKNYTPVLPYEARIKLREEAIDVLIVLGMLFDLDELVEHSKKSPKWARWVERLGYYDEWGSKSD